MKNATIFFNCHGANIAFYLKKSILFVKNYNITLISINNYVKKDTDYTQLEEKHIEHIKNTDLLVLQIIETDRGYLNNSEVLKFCKKTCLVIKLPHYRSSIYEYKTISGFSNKYELLTKWSLPLKIKDIHNIEDTITVIKNEIDIMNNFPYDLENMITYINNALNEFLKIDNLSDITMADYFQNNYKINRLFKGRGYPCSIFFYELINRILIKLGYEPNYTFEDNYFAENTSEPIPEYWYNFCNFTFDNIYFTYGHLEITEYEWYYILLLSNNSNIINKMENIEYISKIRNIR